MDASSIAALAVVCMYNNDVFGWSIHTIDVVGKRGRNSCGKISDEGIVVVDATEGYVVVELGDTVSNKTVHMFFCFNKIT